MFVLNGKTLPVDVAFTHEGIQYPANWLRLTSAAEKAAIGITEQPDPPSYDQRFYWGVDNPKQLEDIGPDANTGITTTGLKTLWKNQQDETSHNLLSESDWYVIRKSEKDIAIPAGITSYRDSVRTICESRKVAIAGASDVDALVGIVTFHNLDWPVKPS